MPSRLPIIRVLLIIPAALKAPALRAAALPGTLRSRTS
jgi:hypothetical protein